LQHAVDAAPKAGASVLNAVAANGNCLTGRQSEIGELCVCTVFDEDSRDFTPETEDRAFMGKTRRTREAQSPSMDHVFVTVATRLKEARQRLKMTQQQVADLAGMQQSHVYGIETGRTNITLRTFIRLAEVLQTDLRALLPETGRGLASQGDGTILSAILAETVSVLQDHETQDAERHRQDAERHRQDVERHRQDVERHKRQSASLKELKSFVALQKSVESGARPVPALSHAKAPVAETEADRGGVERIDRAPKTHYSGSV
jgi:transcriptional regulator with XRE-family HTH domain